MGKKECFGGGWVGNEGVGVGRGSCHLLSIPDKVANIRMDPAASSSLWLLNRVRLSRALAQSNFVAATKVREKDEVCWVRNGK